MTKANFFKIGWLILILFLNLLALSKGAYLQQALATLLLTLSGYPMWVYLKKKEHNIPLVPFFSIAYGLHYGLFTLSPYGVFYTFIFNSSQGVTSSLILSNIGLAAYLIAFYKGPKKLWHSLIPQIHGKWSKRRFRNAAILFALGGFVMAIVNRVVPSSIPLQFLSLITFISDLAIIGVSILFLLYLNGDLQKIYSLFLVFFAILYIFMLAGAGGGWPLAHFAVPLWLIYFSKKKRIPWLLFSTMSIFLILLMATKMEVRNISTDNPFRQAIDHATIVMDFLSKDTEIIMLGVSAIIQRIDYLNLFAYVIDRTPEEIPYWGGETYTPLLWKLIPRIIYPDKPQEVVAKSFPERYSILSAESLQTTTVTLPFLIEFYANFGPLFVPVGMFLLGLIFQIFYHVLNHSRVREWGVISCAFIGSSFIHDIGANFSIVFGGIILNIVALYFLGSFLNGTFLQVRKRHNRVALRIPAGGTG